MNIISTGFDDMFILEPKLFSDTRGYFMESFSMKTLLGAGINVSFVQDNQSSSKRGVLRGLHFQNAPYAQVKLIRVLSGVILDVVVDLRREKSTFSKYFSVELSSENKRQLLIPKGFAHGFIVLSEQAEVLYKTDEYYQPQSEGGILYNDPAIGIDWKLTEEEFVLSDRDKANPLLNQATFNF